jgi:hypothetical protein
MVSKALIKKHKEINQKGVEQGVKYSYKVSYQIACYLQSYMSQIEKDGSQVVPLAELQSKLEQYLTKLPGVNLSNYQYQKEKKKNKNSENIKLETASFTILWDELSANASLSFSITSPSQAWQRENQTEMTVLLTVDSFKVKKQLYCKLNEVEIDYIIRIIKNLPTSIKKVPEKTAEFKKLEAEREMKEMKKQKIFNLRQSSLLTMLDNICSNLNLTYAVREMATRVDLCLSLPDSDLFLVIEIPFANFQNIMPELSDMIQDYLRMDQQYEATTRISRSQKGWVLKWHNSPDDQ